MRVENNLIISQFIETPFFVSKFFTSLMQRPHKLPVSRCDFYEEYHRFFEKLPTVIQFMYKLATNGNQWN